MIVVSGEMRSGTSLMMLVLKKLGLSIAGDRVPKGTRPELCPTGMWEILGVSMGPLLQEVIDEHNITEDVIKIISHGLFYSDLTLVSKIVYCVRDPREIIVSQRSQPNDRTDDYRYKWYNVHNAALVTFMERGKLPPLLFVDYANMMKKPRKEVRRIAEFVNKPYTKKAANVVNKRYYRSKANQVGPNETAQQYHKYLKALCV